MVIKSISQERGSWLSSFVVRRMFTERNPCMCFILWPEMQRFLGAACHSTHSCCQKLIRNRGFRTDRKQHTGILLLNVPWQEASQAWAPAGARPRNSSCWKGVTRPHNLQSSVLCMGFSGGSAGKNLPNKAGEARDAGLSPGSGRSLGVGNGNPLQYSCLGNPRDRGAWQAIVHGVKKSLKPLSDWAQHSTALVSCINKEAFWWNRIEIPEKAQIYMKICHWLKIAYQIGKAWTFKIIVIRTTEQP